MVTPPDLTIFAESISLTSSARSVAVIYKPFVSSTISLIFDRIGIVFRFSTTLWKWLRHSKRFFLEIENSILGLKHPDQ